MQDIIEHFRKQSLTAFSILLGAAVLYNRYLEHKDRLGQKLSRI